MTNDHLKAWEEEIRADERQRIILLITGRPLPLSKVPAPRKQRPVVVPLQTSLESEVMEVVGFFHNPSCKAISEHMKLSPKDVSRTLKALIAAGKVRGTGHGLGKRYSVVIQHRNGADEHEIAE